MILGSGTGDLRSLARGIAHQLAATSGAPAALLAGSVVEGFGNTTSDIDIYLIGPDERAAREQLAAGHRRVDVHRLAPSDIDTALDKVAAATLPSDGSAPPFLDRDLALLARLHTAEVISGAELVEARRQRLDETLARLRQLIVFKWMTAAHAELEDFHGLWDAEELDAAALTARSALLAAGKAVAASCGELYLGQKWVWRQLERSAPTGFPLQDFSHVLRVGLVRDAPAAPVRGLAEWEGLLQTCLAAACTLGWQVGALDAWPSWLPAATAPPGALVRAAGYYPRAFDDAVVLTRPAVRRIRLRPEVAIIWALCDNVPEEGVVARVAPLRETAPVYHNLDAQRCRQIISRLVGAGLLTVT